MGKKTVTIKCYGSETVMQRTDAIKEFREAAAWSEGSEKERYMNILMDLYDGKDYCTDGE